MKAENFSVNLRQVLEEHGLTQSEASRKIGVSRQAIHLFLTVGTIINGKAWVHTRAALAKLEGRVE